MKVCQSYTPGENTTVDEGLEKFNGRLSFKQYMPMKPDKFGIKVWLLADTDTYYVPCFQVYLGDNGGKLKWSFSGETGRQEETLCHVHKSWQKKE